MCGMEARCQTSSDHGWLARSHPVVSEKVFRIDPRITEHHELTVPMDVQAELCEQRMVVSWGLQAGNVAEFTPLNRREDFVTPLRGAGVRGAGLCGDEVTKDGAANDEVVHCSGMVTLRVQPRMQRLHLAHRTVARHVLIVLPCILCKVRSAPEQAATKTLIRTIAEKGEDRLRGCSMKQSGLMHIALKLVRQACERLLQHISDSKTRYLDLPITDLLRDTLPLHRVAPPELGVLNAPRARQFELLVLALLHDISS
mmetsp:Transcript_139149/g.444588  ORF Transcript_139149/g.444588 Transcript_139149/m.444588 type:complete len:256 (+) Transcript_139149:424-1191(+)